MLNASWVGMCLNGCGGPVDLLGAFKWYQQSAKQGDASSLFSLGQMYAVGNFKKAAAQGHARSADALKQLGFDV
ncbi:sel1 repeat family protein [Myxococcus sp. AM009]|uniref:sel1 repeat family protein n=1 Tax=Myxococcus sp. AM009 TaxID=2745137 RepID=UPI001595B156|nr:sel1 repeat family protein [Myxococcus sp. AM009]NVJ01748.1 sel1 repeat family protein [Myxococcus sp. AM009]